jgi:multiple sugar transport system substrate-binding protein
MRRSIHLRARLPRLAPRVVRRGCAALLATGLVASLAACGGGDSGDSEGSKGKSITVWIEEDLPDRVAATQKIVDQFTKDTGIKVKLTPVAEDQFNQILTSNAAAGDLPDVMGGIPLGQIRTPSAR